MVLVAIAIVMAKNELESNSPYAISPTAVGTKKIAMFLVMTVAVFFTFSGLIILKNRLRNSKIMPSTLPGIKP